MLTRHRAYQILIHIEKKNRNIEREEHVLLLRHHLSTVSHTKEKERQKKKKMCEYIKKKKLFQRSVLIRKKQKTFI